jgi:hypothetical protein
MPELRDRKAASLSLFRQKESGYGAPRCLDEQDF